MSAGAFGVEMVTWRNISEARSLSLEDLAYELRARGIHVRDPGQVGRSYLVERLEDDLHKEAKRAGK